MLGAAQIEGLPCKLVRGFFKCQQAQAQLVALAGELLCVYAYAVALDLKEHGAAGYFQLVDVLQGRVGSQLRPKLLMHLQAKVGIFAGVGAGLLYGYMGKGDLLCAFAAYAFVAGAAAPQMAQGKAF